ncbi:MAG: cbb3-type cytochrome c oxidase N-terminal domain-containing protein [Cyclobacteriaceae bacterium]
MKKLLIILITPLLLLSPTLSRGAGATELVDEYMVEIALGLVVLISIIVLLVLVVVLQAMKVLARLNKPEEAEAVEEQSSWQQLMQSLTKSVPVEEEEEILTDHSYDGIRELDNRLPPWWLYGFYFTIVFGIGYVAYFHVFKAGDLQAAEYQTEMAQAEKQIEQYLASLENSIDESNVELSLEESELALGKEAYIQNCVPCHGAEGQGGVGPNFTDKYWIHGGDVKHIFRVIKYGVPEKGMVPWQNKFTPKQMQQLSSYIISLEGTNPPNPKEPQGELYERIEEKVEALNDSTSLTSEPAP